MRDEMECSRCGNVFLLSENANGPALAPSAICPHCGAVHKFGNPAATLRALDAAIDAHPGRIRVSDEGVRFLRDPGEESWVQRYVKEEFSALGFDGIRGPYSAGPDFRALRDGKWLVVEVETTWKNYLAHKHHLDSRFSEVAVLIALESSEHFGDERGLLPPEVLFIPARVYDPWFSNAWAEYQSEIAPEVAMQKELAKIRVPWPGRETPRPSECPDSDRDMATCPDCGSCAYWIDAQLA